MINLKSRSIVYSLIFLLAFGILLIPVSAQANHKQNESQGKICGVYFTGIGCPHCAAADSVILNKYLEKYPSFLVIEYEIYRTPVNGKVMSDYMSGAGISKGIPQMIIKNSYEVGESTSGRGPTTTWTKKKIESLDSAKCKLADGSQVAFENLSLNSLPGRPKIWTGNRILIRTSQKKTDNQLLHQLLTTKRLGWVINQHNFSKVEPKPVPLSGNKVKFDKAIRLEGWKFQWNSLKYLFSLNNSQLARNNLASEQLAAQIKQEFKEEGYNISDPSIEKLGDGIWSLKSDKAVYRLKQDIKEKGKEKIEVYKQIGKVIKNKGLLTTIRDKLPYLGTVGLIFVIMIFLFLRWGSTDEQEKEEKSNKGNRG